MREFNHSTAAPQQRHQFDTEGTGMNPSEDFRSSPPHLWTTSDLARFLVCSERNILFLRNKGLPSVRVGGLVRFDPQAVRNWLSLQDEPADRRHAQLKGLAASSDPDVAECAAADLHKEFTSTP